MLNRTQLLNQLSTIQGSLFADYSKEYDIAAQTWSIIVNDEQFQARLSEASSPWLIPTWKNSLSEKYQSKSINDYIIIGVDGSQIYPDRHSGTLCSMVNVGTVLTSYEKENTKCSLKSIPKVHLFSEQELHEAIDTINCERQELEFMYGLKCARESELKQKPLVLFDGSLVFWHLENMESSLKDKYISRYIALLEKYYFHQIPIVGYISMPKNKELVNLVRMQLSDFSPSTNDGHNAVNHVLDSHIVASYLKPYERTIIFEHHSPILEFYPKHLKPHFFYLHVGDEVVRIELPKWLTEVKPLVDYITTLIVDQAKKGYGYPIALSEAHEQAVIKGPDREFFYQMIDSMSKGHKQHVLSSLKLSKKRRVSV